MHPQDDDFPAHQKGNNNGFFPSLLDVLLQLFPKIFQRLGILDTSLRLKEHVHTFVNKGGRVAELDFR